MLANPARVMHCQLKYLTVPDDCRYRPLKDINTGGIIMLADKRPQDAQDIVENVAGQALTFSSPQLMASPCIFLILPVPKNRSRGFFLRVKHRLAQY